MPTNITASHSIHIRATPEAVWDFTQDYGRRRDWDRSIRDATVLDSGPPSRVRVSAKGGLRCVFAYKQYDRPHRTSLAMVEVEPRWFSGGGGSWSYEAEGHGTR